MANFIQRSQRPRLAPHPATLGSTIARPPHPATVAQPKALPLVGAVKPLSAHPATIPTGSNSVAQRADIFSSSDSPSEDSGSDFEPESGDDGDDEFYEYHERAAFDHSTIPRNKEVAKRVRGVLYTFRYTGNGTVDFKSPVRGPAANIIKDVNICDPTNDDLIHGTLLPLKQPRGDNSAHFRAANQRAGLGNSALSPKGYTWHHHPDKGRMQLIDRQVHAEFKHVGGKAIWGTV